MKKITLLLLALCTFFACKNDDDASENLTCETEGNFLGFDAALCACCGGAYLEMNGDTFYILTMPTTNFPIDTFPRAVKFDWETATGTCADFHENAIDLSCLEVL